VRETAKVSNQHTIGTCVFDQLEKPLFASLLNARRAMLYSSTD
jgi:hypothetical protein